MYRNFQFFSYYQKNHHLRRGMYHIIAVLNYLLEHGAIYVFCFF